MMVTFVSQCEKNALKKTRRVLDAFANRIGDNTWQTLITEDGLITVKKMLRQTASKSTAVSCFWIRSRARSQFLWVVGNKAKFNAEGIVPVNSTSKGMEKFVDKNQWQTIDVIKYAAAIAGLFHDFGKANILFQNKLKGESELKGEPYRHEWLSLRLFQAFAEGKSDIQWLTELSEIEKDSISTCFRDGIDSGNNHPINQLAPFAQLIAWLIVSHHKLPLVPHWKDRVARLKGFKHIKVWFDNNFEAVWNSYQCKDDDNNNLLEDNWNFDKALPVLSYKWRSHCSTIASKALIKLKPLLGIKKDWLHDELFTTHLARLSLMLSDHYYSSLKLEELNSEWQSPSYQIFANTDRKTKELKQQLDEHLIGVAYHAKRISFAISSLNHSVESLPENSFLQGNVDKKFKDAFGWQDKARKLSEKISNETVKHGFFGINMASTGKGKTLANAKIMYALGNETGRVRFSVALGLRTLTLQTGREFRRKLELNNEQLAIAVGGISVKQLFENEHTKDKEVEQLQVTGSESQNDIIDPDLYIDYTGLKAHSLSKWTKQEENLDKLIQAPILVCTIDHLIGATEGTKGGKQIAPMLRLLTSDLILDEPDDFGLEDLPALCRLVNWAAMLGSKVLLSTATMPPAMAFALFQAYQAGWSQYAKANIENWNGETLCAWFDEDNSIDKLCNSSEDYQKTHVKFVDNRIKKLIGRVQVKQLGSIQFFEHSQSTYAYSMAKAIQESIVALHQKHHGNNGVNTDEQTISIGLVRMANINPLVAVSKALLQQVVPEDYCIHYCVYHSRYPLAIRSHLENHLDTILNRKEPQKAWDNLKSILAQNKQKHHIFVVLASPVAEVGRDHDYDWAIIEPSSMRSIIQIAGRVLRHRNIQPTSANIILLNNNYKTLRGEQICYTRPGFESKELKLENHALADILSKDQYKKISAIERIKTPDGYVEAKGENLNLNALEHRALLNQLFKSNKPAKVWWQEQVHWCGEVQKQQRFRQSNKDNAFYLFLKSDDIVWRWKNESVYPTRFGEGEGIAKIYLETELEINEGNHFWFDLQPQSVYQKLAKDFDIEIDEVAERFGEIRLIEYNERMQDEYYYHPNLGIYKKVEN